MCYLRNGDHIHLFKELLKVLYKCLTVSPVEHGLVCLSLSCVRPKGLFPWLIPLNWSHPWVTTMIGSDCLLTTTSCCLYDWGLEHCPFRLSFLYTWNCRFNSLKLLPDNPEGSPGFTKDKPNSSPSGNQLTHTLLASMIKVITTNPTYLHNRVTYLTSFPPQINTSISERRLCLVVISTTMRAHCLFPAIQRRHLRKCPVPKWNHIHILRHTLKENVPKSENNEQIFPVNSPH